jgi:hypothetical protein
MTRRVRGVKKLVGESKIHLDSWNVRSLTDKLRELIDTAVSTKKKCYKYLHHHRSDENIQKYKQARRNANKSVSKSRGQIYTELYRKLDTKEDKYYVYKIAKL